MKDTHPRVSRSLGVQIRNEHVSFQMPQTHIFALMCHAMVALLSSLSFEFFPKLSLPPRESLPEDIFRIQGLDSLAFSILLLSPLTQQVWQPPELRASSAMGPLGPCGAYWAQACLV